MSHPPRTRIPEWVDDPATPESDLFAAMEGIAAINSLLRYPALVAWLAERELGRSPRRVLDVGTGVADIPVGFAARARKAGAPLTAVGIDLNPRTIRRARELVGAWPEVAVEERDLFALPAEWEPFDVVTSHRTLHHLTDEEAGAFFAAMDRALAPGGVLLVADLVRGAPCVAATWALMTVIRAARITRRDGIASIRNSFREGEALALAGAAGVTYLRPTALRPPCHFLLIGRKPGNR
ncbi:MAG: methyltransferase domain-containing protein [Candidatus Sericytochromatia bacterium]|nr:methyltransferase domain-containing protein [Candidatus Tanganyikabacteria bacterium]